jgi:predicted homoserine dehydrogenase-like protein
MAYTEKLKAHRAKLGRDVKIALVGAGQMGHGFGCQVDRMPAIHWTWEPFFGLSAINFQIGE